MQVTLPTGYEKALPAYDLPTFQNATDGVLPLTLAGTGESGQAFYVTHDGGNSWGVSQVVPSSYEYSPGSTIATAVVGTSTVIPAPAHSNNLTSIYLGSSPSPKASVAASLAIDKNSAITKINFASATQGWALTSDGSCNSAKTQCTQTAQLLSINGSSVQDITPVGSVSPKTTTVVTNQGFDTACSPSTSNMQTWKSNSPYTTIGVYIGGQRAACVNTNASWFSTVLNSGWSIIPIWVGPQGISNDFTNISTSTAASEGVTDADNAVNAALNTMGLSSPTIIYYDMEYYGNVCSSCRPQINAFLNAWIGEVQAKGLLGGIYSYYGYYTDWQSYTHGPSAVWIPEWQYSSYNSGVNAAHIPNFPDNLWINARAWQYAGGHSETYGGVSVNIDCDVVDGIVATAGYAIGQGSTYQSMFQDAYARNNGSAANWGVPDGPVHWYNNTPGYNLEIQDIGTKYNIYHDVNATDPSQVRAYVLHDAIDSYYVANGGPISFGVPTSDEFTNAQGNLQANFTNGYITIVNGSPTYQLWPPNDNSGWFAQYYNNVNLASGPTLVQNEHNGLNFSYSWPVIGTPPNNAEGTPPFPQQGMTFGTNWSARYTRTQYFNIATTYQIVVQADDGVRVWLDGNLVIDEWIPSPGNVYKYPLQMPAGNHSIKIEYYQGLSAAQLKFGVYGVGVGSDVANANVARQARYQAAYTRNGGSSNVGYPVDYMSVWNNTLSVQDYDANESVIEQDSVWEDAHGVTPGTCKAFAVPPDVHGFYISYGNSTANNPTYLGSATSDAYTVSGVKRQAFTNGFISMFNPPTYTSFATSAPVGTWLQTFYNNTQLACGPAWADNGSSLNFDYDWENSAPRASILPSDYSALLTRTDNFTGGNYNIAVGAAGTVQVWLDGASIINHTQDNAYTVYTANVNLSSGNHSLKIAYSKQNNPGHLSFSATPNQPTTTVPTTQPTTVATTPTTPAPTTVAITPAPTTVATTAPTIVPTTPAPDNGSSFTYYLPYVANNAAGVGGSYTTFVTVQNTGNGAANFTITNFDTNGNVLSTDSDNYTALAPNVKYNALGLASGQAGSATIVSTQPLAIVVSETGNFNGQTVSTSYPAINSTTGTGTTIYAPIALKNSYGSFSTGLVLRNTGTSDTTATVQYYNDSGSAVSNQIVTVRAQNSVQVLQSGVAAQLPNNFSGWAVITSNNGQQLAGIDVETNPSTGFVATVACTAVPGKTVYVPVVFQNAFGNFITGMQLVNPNNTIANVTVTITRKDGTVMQLTSAHASFPIAAHSDKSFFHSADVFPELVTPNGGFVGTAVITSDQPLLAIVNQTGSVGGVNFNGSFGTLLGGAAQVAMPSVFRDATAYSSGLQIVNTSSTASTATIAYYDKSGNKIYQTKLTADNGGPIESGGSINPYQGSDSNLPDGFDGTAVISADSNGATFVIVGNISNAKIFYTYAEPNYLSLVQNYPHP